MTFSSFILLLSGLTLLLAIAGAKKRIEIFSMQIFGSSDNCAVAMDVVANATNAVDFLLKDYEITFKHINEPYWGSEPVKEFVQWTRTNRYQVPLMTGPTLSSSCDKLAPVIHHVNYVGIGGGCTGSIQLTGRRDIAPNFYRPMVPVELNALARIELVKKIGNWSKMSIIANSQFAFDYTFAIETYKIALKNGIQVSFFDLVPRVTPQLIEKLKMVNTRIILFDTYSTQLVAQFLCETYKQGITGSKYVFIFQISAFITLDTYDVSDIDGCTMEMIKIQLKSAFFTGFQEKLYFNKSQKTILNMDMEEFDRQYHELGQGRSSRAQYSYRYKCHDTALQIVLALDEADKYLKANYDNLTIGNFNDGDEEATRTITQAVNQSVAKTDFFSLRVGRFKYSQRLEVDNDPIQILKWINEEEGIQPVAIVQRNFDSKGIELDDFEIKPTATKLVWATPDGKPPRDSAQFALKTIKFPTTIAIVVLILGVFVSGLAIVVFTMEIKKQSNQMGMTKTLVFFACQAILTGACLSGAVAFDQITLDQFSKFCNIRDICLALGCLAGSSILTAWTFLPLKKVDRPDDLGSDQQWHRNRTRSFKQYLEIKTNQFLPKYDNQKSKERFVTLLASCFMIFPIIFVITWKVMDGKIVKLHFLHQYYDQEMDSFVQLDELSCFNAEGEMISWELILFIFNISILLVGVLNLLNRRAHGTFNLIGENQMLQIALFNSTIITVATVLIIVSFDWAHHRDIIISFMAIFLAVTQFLIVMKRK